MNTKAVGFATLLGAVTALAGAGAWGQLAPLKQSAPPTTGDKLAGESATAQLAGDHDQALRLADEAIKAEPHNPWAYYARGDALAALHRQDEAIAAFGEAEHRHSEAGVWGKSIAIWGQANVLSQAGRCQEAAPIFERYALLVEKFDKGAADLAHQYAKRCSPRPALR